MSLKLYNSLTKSIEPFTPLTGSKTVTIYSCGPTLYDDAHIGNLSAFIAADVLRRVVTAHDYNAVHVMNFTDIDDKTIRRSSSLYPDMEPMQALKMLTTTYGAAFLDDMRTIGNDVAAFTFVKATDSSTITGMQQLIQSLLKDGFAYIADDGVYFSIDAYKKSDKTYGQLVDITGTNTGSQRINNDEYDKESAHDFALWKVQKGNEPAWEFYLDDKDMSGRPGWHLECSVMSQQSLGQPFDIHTGGVDLKFPHHENEIAQSTAGYPDSTYAKFFVHNEHILIDGKKMSKSLNNFFTLTDLTKQAIDPLAFRLLVLQSHYRRSTHYSSETIAAATNRLKNWRNIAVLRHQTHETLQSDTEKPAGDSAVNLLAVSQAIIEALGNDIDTPEALRIIDESFSKLENVSIKKIHRHSLVHVLDTIDTVLGLQLQATTPDISDEQKQLIANRTHARTARDWKTSDAIRDTLLRDNITLNDTPHGTIWQQA